MEAREGYGYLTVHLVRHGQTDWNVETRLQGWTDIPLNETGIGQAAAAAAALAGRPITAVLSSDLSRARETAEAIATELGLEVEIEPALRERNYGAAEGRVDADLYREYGAGLDESWADPDFSFEGGESRRHVYGRVGTCLAELLGSPPGGEIVIVSHGGALRVALGFLQGAPVEELPSLVFENASITTVIVDREALPEAA